MSEGLPVNGGDGQKAIGTNYTYAHYLRQDRRWHTLRRAAQIRSQGWCEICGQRAGQELAHLTYVRVFHELLTDVLWACVRCHRALDDRI
jgi:hypothetical protein